MRVIQRQRLATQGGLIVSMKLLLAGGAIAVLLVGYYKLQAGRLQQKNEELQAQKLELNVLLERQNNAIAETSAALNQCRLRWKKTQDAAIAAKARLVEFMQNTHIKQQRVLNHAKTIPVDCSNRPIPDELRELYKEAGDSNETGRSTGTSTSPGGSD